MTISADAIISIIIVGIFCPLIVWYVQKSAQKRDQLVTRLVSEKDESTKEWRRALTERFDRFEKFIEKIQSDLGNKVNTDECDKRCEDKWRRIYNHEHLVDCNNAGCGIRRTSGVVTGSHGGEHK